MLKKSPSSILTNDKGMAVFEIIPILIVIVIFVNFSLGFFGAIHTGILHSIASRNYAFETFRNKSNLTYFRDNPTVHFAKISQRVHGTKSENQINVRDNNNWVASARTIDFFKFENRAAETRGTDKGQHTKTRDLPGGRISESVHQGVNPIWIKTTYGICLNAACGS